MNWSYESAMMNIHRSGNNSVTGGSSYRVNANGSGSEWGAVGAQLGADAGMMLTSLFIGILSQKSAENQSRREISQGIANIVNEMPAKIDEQVSQFNKLFGSMGVTVNSQGVVEGKTYDELLSSIKSEIEAAEAETKSGDNVKQQFKDYQAAVSRLDSLQRTQTSITNLDNEISQLDGQIDAIDKRSFTGANGQYVVKSDLPHARDFVKYLSQADRMGPDGKPIPDYQLADKAKGTQAYQTALRELQQKCDELNNLVATKKQKEAQKTTLLNTAKGKDGNPVGSAEGLSKAITEAQAEVESLGKAYAEGNSGVSVKAHSDNLALLKKQKATLEAHQKEFASIPKTIERMSACLADAKRVQGEEKDIDEAKNAKKYARTQRNKSSSKASGAWWARLFTWSKTKSPEAKQAYTNAHNSYLTAKTGYKDAKSYLTQQKQERDAAYKAFMEKYFQQQE